MADCSKWSKLDSCFLLSFHLHLRKLFIPKTNQTIIPIDAVAAAISSTADISELKLFYF